MREETGDANTNEDGITPEDRERIATAVSEAEAYTGLQIAVYIGPVEGDPGLAAEQILDSAGTAHRPAVLILVAPEARRLEVRTAPSARERLTDREAQVVVDAMLERFRDGDLVAGLLEGIHVVSELVGPARAGEEPGEDLPNLLG